MDQGRPLFNVKAVVQQTGLRPDTLRAWERRYGLPTPERSSGGHRLYSQSDIDTIKWLMARQREGLSISRAVVQWRQVEAEGHGPQQATTPIAMRATTAPLPRPSGESISQLRQQWVDACLAYDEQRAEQHLNQAFALYSPETVAVELLQRAVTEIGEDWYRGNATVQQEHFCSSLTVRRLEALIMAAPSPIRQDRILAACPPEEHHVIGLLVPTFLLRRRGWEVVYLGANVPAEQLEITVAAVKPQLVIMAAQQLHTAATLKQAAEVLRPAEIPLAYGGLVFNLLPALRNRIPGHFLGEQIEAVPEMVEALLVAPRSVPTPETVSDAYLQASEHFQERRGSIEAHVIQSLNSGGYTHNHLALANRELGLNIAGALALGNMDFLGADIEWMTALLKNHGLPAEALFGYLHAYHQTALEQLDERGQPITAWLGNLVNGHSPH